MFKAIEWNLQQIIKGKRMETSNTLVNLRQIPMRISRSEISFFLIQFSMETAFTICLVTYIMLYETARKFDFKCSRWTKVLMLRRLLNEKSLIFLQTFNKFFLTWSTWKIIDSIGYRIFSSPILVASQL